jgi:hypothetical protein
MDRQEMELIVLARIPDLGSVGRTGRYGKSLASRGRVIGQALSFKLLAIAALLLVAMALVPLTFRTSSQPPAHSPTTPADATTPAAQAAAPAPIPASPFPTPAVAPEPKVAIAPPTPAAAEIPRMSKWPDPAHPTSPPVAANEEPRAGANQSMAVRPPEYLRNNHDRTRSGIR